LKFSKRAKRLASFLGIYFCIALGANAQTGLPPFGSFQSGGFDTINLQNLNVNFAIPIMSSQGRDLPLSYSMFYNTAFWRPGAAWFPTVDQSGNPIWGWNIPGQLGTITYQTEIITTPGCGSPTHYYDFVFTDRFGTGHAFNSTVTTGPTLNYYGTNTCSLTISDQGYANDGSGLGMYSTGGVSRVTTPTGISQYGSTLTDNNGNYISQDVVSSSESDWTDSVGRVALKVITSGTTTTVKWLDQTNNYQTTTITSSSFNIRTNYGIPGMVEYSGTANLPTEIDLPNGQKYLFTYEPTPGYSGYTTGRLHRITFPAGGYCQSDYAASNDGVDPATGTPAFLTRTINDGTNSVQWQYGIAHSGSNTVTTVTAPQMPYDSAPNQSVFTFNSTGQETQELYYQGSATSGTLLREIDKTWASNGTPATLATTLADTNQKSEVDTTYADNGNLTQVNEYDWGASSSGAVGTGTKGSLLRGTSLSYWTLPGPPSLILIGA